MSSIGGGYGRKRFYSSDFGDNSDNEDDAPPAKLKKKNPRNKISIAISARLRNLSDWFSDLPVKTFFSMAIKAGSTIPQETIIIDDDDDSEDVVPIEEADSEPRPDVPNPFIQRLNKSRKLVVAERHLEQNGSCSTRSLLNEISHSANSCFSFKSINGSSSTLAARYYGNGAYNKRLLRSDNLKRSALVSKPDTDIEILLETKPKAAESDEIEILSESPSIKQKSPTSHRSIRLSRRIAAARGSSQEVPAEYQRSTVARSQSSTSKNFTAHEVVRLQEKEQYKLLLEKYISGNQYIPAKKKQFDAEVQVDETNFDLSTSHFKKEVLQQPATDFLEKYCKPCRLMSYSKAEKDKPKEREKENEPMEITIDDDDEIQVMEETPLVYKPTYKQKPDFFSSNWITELKSSVAAQTEERLKIVKEQEKAIERLKKERILKRLTVEPPSSTEAEFPELTAEMEEAVDQALYTGIPEDNLVKITSDWILRKDIETLDGLNWLNDLVINSYFDLIIERSKKEGYPTVHAYNTFFYSTYKTKGYSSVRRWTRKFDIFGFDLNFIPIHLGVHWCLAVIDHRSKKVCYYDSMGSGEENCLDLLHEYLCLEYKDKKGTILDPSSYTKEVMKDIPHQMNGSDCGMFTLKYAEYISRDAEITFTQEHMQYFRRRMVYELLTKQLL